MSSRDTSLSEIGASCQRHWKTPCLRARTTTPHSFRGLSIPSLPPVRPFRLAKVVPTPVAFASVEKQNRVEQISAIVALVLLLIGCFLVLRPFISALLWAAILCFSTWPFYSRLVRWLGNRRTVAASLMTLLIATIVVVPFVIAGFSLADDAKKVVSLVQEWYQKGLPDPPQWLHKIPLVGDKAVAQWQDLAENRERLVDYMKRLVGPARELLLKGGAGLGQGIFQLTLSVFIAFFFYRDGVDVADRFTAGIKRIIGDRTQRLIDVVGGTIQGVVYGMLGTALAQGVLASFGFAIAGVPGAFFLGLLTFFLSLVPAGPPLVWIPAAIWLFSKGSIGWGIFLSIWGLVLVSGIDNVLKPMLISRGAKMPFVLVFMGVLGGVIAFGFIGVFIGPTLMAVGYSLAKEWSEMRKEAKAEVKPEIQNSKSKTNPNSEKADHPG